MSETRSLYLRTPGLAEAAETFLSSEVLRPGPLWIVDTVAHRFGVDDPDILLALALVLQAQERGHVGLDLLRASAALPIPEHILERERHEGTDPVPAPAWPEDPATWQQRVLDSGMVGPSGKPFVQGSYRFQGEERALILTQRMAREQQRLAEALMALASEAPSSRIGPDRVEVSVAALFPNETDGQGARALRAAAERCLTVITGGPGTGKTFSIKRLLAMLFEQAPEGLDLRVVLAAPTGKAAVRMTEAMGEGLAADLFSPAIRARLRKLPAQTVHKLLRIHPDTGATRYGPDEPLAVDVVVVDEASMLDVVLMRKLLAAVGEGTRLVLLGDRDQLASVESGTVLADLVAGYFAGETAGLAGRVVAFSKNHRSKSAPTVAAIAEAVQAATEESLDRAVELLMGRPRPDEETKPDGVSRVDPQPGRGAVPPEFYASLARPYLEGGYVAALAAALKTGPSTALDRAALVQALGRYRVLATHRKGPLGVSGLNRQIGALVRARLQAAWGEQHAGGTLPTRGGLWLGEPVLVTTNAYDVDLRNGDIGLVLPDDTGRLVVWFPVSKAGERGVRAVSIPRLPPHGPALAMTVHKAQGSQFEEVAVVLAGRPSPIQTRELVYTGLTRASARVHWVGSEEELRDSLARPVGRISALGEWL